MSLGGWDLSSPEGSEEYKPVYLKNNLFRKVATLERLRLLSEKQDEVLDPKDLETVKNIDQENK